MRFTAPDGITSAFISSGPVPVVDGAIEVPDDTTTGDIKGLSASGFLPAPSAPILSEIVPPPPPPEPEHEEE